MKEKKSKMGLLRSRDKDAHRPNRANRGLIFQAVLIAS